jgi:hypothetical protein
MTSLKALAKERAESIEIFSLDFSDNSAFSVAMEDWSHLLGFLPRFSLTHQIARDINRR